MTITYNELDNYITHTMKVDDTLTVTMSEYGENWLYVHTLLMHPDILDNTYKIEVISTTSTPQNRDFKTEITFKKIK